MGKTRDLLKKIWDIKGTFHARMGMIKDRNSKKQKGLRRNDKNTEELYKNSLNDLDNPRWCGHLPKSDILGYEVKWDLGRITMNKASGGDGIPAELFQTLRDEAVEVLHSICQEIWKIAVATGLEKVSFHSNPKEGQCQRVFQLPYNCAHFTW